MKSPLKQCVEYALEETTDGLSCQARNGKLGASATANGVFAMNLKNIEKEIQSCLETFYRNRLQGLEKLSLKKVLRKKNPYLPPSSP